MEDIKKLKILCLHGYRQDSEMFRSKLGAFQKGVKKFADLVFIDAPHVVIDEEPRSLESKSGRSWWFTTMSGQFDSSKPSAFANGIDESIAKIRSFLKSEGPFDGLLGFSQGAAFVALLCCLKELEDFQECFQFVILVAGFRSPSSIHQRVYSVCSKLPSLHIIGEEDKVISKDRSQELLKNFEKPLCIYHGGGHFLPSKADVKQKCQEFLQNMQSRLKY